MKQQVIIVGPGYAVSTSGGQGGSTYELITTYRQTTQVNNEVEKIKYIQKWLDLNIIQV